MKTLLNCCRPVICGALLLWGTSAGAAETNMLRLAIGPIFAPAGNAALEKAATTLPDMITADLSRDSRFQMVERDKVNAIWSEIHLAEGERMSANAVIKMGHFLSCDWLVSGSFAQTDTGPQIWVKVINIQDSVVVDLECVPFDQTNYSATAKAIADFLVKARALETQRIHCAGKIPGHEHYRQQGELGSAAGGPAGKASAGGRLRCG